MADKMISNGIWALYLNSKVYEKFIQYFTFACCKIEKYSS